MTVKKNLIFAFVLLVSKSCVNSHEGLTAFQGSRLIHVNTLKPVLSPVLSGSDIIIEKDEKVEEILFAEKVKNSKNLANLKSWSFLLEDCHKYLMDPRLDGASEVVDFPKFNLFIANQEKQEDLYISDSGEIKVKTTETFRKILETEREKGRIFNERREVLQKVVKRCQAKLSAARVSKGLPAEKYSAVLKKTPSGDLVVIRKAEKNLDDAFEIKGIIESEKEGIFF